VKPEQGVGSFSPAKLIKINRAYLVEMNYNICMLNKKGVNNMSKKEINNEVQIANSNLWVIVHEVSKGNKDLAIKLDHAIADMKEASYRSGQYDGLEIAKKIARGEYS